MPSSKSVKPTIQLKMKQQSKKKVPIKSTSENSVSETISFVIKGKLTPIKPTFVPKKIDVGKKLMKLDKKLKTPSDIPRKKNVNKIKTAAGIQKAKNFNSRKLNAETKVKRIAAVNPGNSRTRLKVLMKESQNKTVKPKIKKVEKPKKETEAKKTLPKKIKTQVNVSPRTSPKKKADSKTCSDDIKKKKTIAKLLKQANKVLAQQPLKRRKSNITKTKPKKQMKNEKRTNEDDMVQDLSEDPRAESKDVKEITADKSERSPKNREFKEDSGESSEDHNLEEIRQFLKKQSTDASKKKVKTNCDNLKKGVQSKLKKKPCKIVRKKVRNSQIEELKMKKLKLFGFWNGPKRQRVASLNALAKVHCLYENEGRISMLDNPESLKVKKEIIDNAEDEIVQEQHSPIPKRSLRCVPGLRGAGKYWDMHNESSSSSDEDEQEIITKKVTKVKKEPLKKDCQEKNQKQRKRKQTEIIMDLKDMVVRKRMASLNATAILAASYSQEKRSSKSSKSESTDNTDSSDDESFSEEEEKKKCYEDDVKKEDKVIEVHAKPNKKVAVILNQDTDVTITGVYVNSTTRSTHHEGYCSIAGMQYRISATSHTQTAATAVATETLLQSSSSTTTENTNAETLTPTGKSYKPLDALSNMRPPSGGAHHQTMGPPQHVMSMSPSAVRHGCSSAFSAPHPSAYHHGGPGHHPAPIGGEPGYIHGELPHDPGYSPFLHKGYYQPAGPLITVPVGHGQPPVAKSAPLSEISPTTPSPLSSHQPHPAPSSNGDSSDSEVIITSVTAGKDAPPPPQAHSSYRYSQYPPSVPPPSYSYPYSSHYYHPTPPPPSYPPHDVCYSPGPYVHHKFPPAAYRRYLGGPQYYTPNPPPSTQELYAVPPTHAQPSQQVVTTTPVSGSGSPYQSSVIPPPPSSLLEPYPPTLVETYPTHYYSGYPPGPPSACYSHAPPPRAVPFINGPYQSSCPCPMRSCPKNGLTGPLTGDSKRSNTLPKGNMPPLPPVALALPKEPTSDGPPSPARGSAGMPPPPSPAGATYQQQPTPPTKQESVTPPNEIPTEKKRKARVGKAMVRNNIQNTMLLMCNPITPSCVKREIESPKENNIVNVPEKDEDEDEAVALTNDTKISSEFENLVPQPVVEDIVPPPKSPVTLEPPLPVKIEEKTVESLKVEPILEPVISTVGENVKVKNMKRKLSSSVEIKEETPASPPKKLETEAKVNGSYKNLIKKNTSSIRINNGKRKLIQESNIPRKLLNRETILSRRKAQKKRQLGSSKNSADVRKTKQLMKTKSALSNNKNTKENCKNMEEHDEELAESKENIKCNQKIAPAMLDNLIARNSMDRTMACVISDTIRTNVPKKVDKVKQVKEPLVPTTVSAKKSTKKTYNTKKKKTKNLRKKISELIPQKSLQSLRWSNGWSWKGEPYEAKVFLNSDETTVVRKCYPSMIHHSGDLIEVKDCVLLKAGARRNELPFVAKIAALWENPDDGEMMMSLLWYYRPEHTEQGRLPTDQPDEVFASRHKDSNSVACIDDKCFVLTFNEYCRYRKHLRRVEEGIEEQISPRIPVPEPYPRSHRQPPHEVKISPEMVFFCRRVYDFRQKRIVKNPT